MVNSYIYAKDYSGSTSGNEYYHKNGLTTLELFKSDVKEIQSALPGQKSQIVYLHWDDQCQRIDEQRTRSAYMNRDGRGYTSPERIIEWIQGNLDGNVKIKLLYIITDGLIDSCSFDRCLALNANMNYEKVVFHAINEHLHCIDLSVTASFIKSRCTIYRNNELFDETDISKEYDYDSITPDNFATEKESLKSYIKFKFLTAPKSDVKSLAEIDKLKHLKYRLNKVSIKSFPDTKDKDTFLREFKNTNWYKSLLSKRSYNLTVDIERSVTTLINYIISEKKSYGFDALKFENTFSNEVTDEPIEDINFTADQEIEFPDIILDDEKGIPVILCTHLNLLEKLIFQNSDNKASFSKFNSMMECPLFLLEDPDINESLGYFYTLTVYKQLIQQETKVEPRTRRPFHGGLVLVDTDDFDAYNDYILSATYFDFKKVKYNISLFYFVLWKICEKKQWMDENVVAQFKKYALRRISTTKCRIGLSSLPLDPQVNASLPSALWYCVELSTLIFKDDPEHFAHERLRMFYGVAHAMIEILINLNYNLDLETINKRNDLMRHVMTLKRIPKRKEKVLYLVEKIFKKVNGFLVAEIECQTNVKKLNYLKLKHNEMLRDDVVTEAVNLEEYVHFLHDSGDAVVHICEKTLRPFFMIDKDVSFYSELYNIAKQVVVENIYGVFVLKNEIITQLEFSRILSPYNLYLRYVKKNEKFPTLVELNEYILKKKKFKDDLVTIFPENVHSAIERVFVGYESVIKGLSVKDFVEVSDKFVGRFDRIKGEKRVVFESNDEIKEFLFKEEHRVNLKKVLQEKTKKGSTDGLEDKSGATRLGNNHTIKKKKWIPPPGRRGRARGRGRRAY